MKVLILVTSLKPESGWGTYGLNVATGLTASGHEVIALVNEKSTQTVCKEIVCLPDPLGLLNSSLAKLKTTAAVVRAVRTYRPDVIHSLVEPYILAFPLSKRLCCLPKWGMNLHGTYGILPLAEPTTTKLMQKAYGQATRFLVCSDFTKHKVLTALSTFATPELTKKVEQRMQMFKLGIELPPYAPSQKKKAVKQILCPGIVKPRKGIREMLLACAAFRDLSEVPFHVTIVGHRNDKHAYVQEVDTLVKEKK